jgi:hypothetical protein
MQKWKSIITQGSTALSSSSSRIGEAGFPKEIETETLEPQALSCAETIGSEPFTLQVVRSGVGSDVGFFLMYHDCASPFYLKKYL